MLFSSGIGTGRSMIVRAKGVCALLAGGLFITVGCAEDPSDVPADRILVRVGDREITRGEIDTQQRQQEEVEDAQQPWARGLQMLVDRELMVLEAERRQLDQLPEVQQRLFDKTRERLHERVLNEDIRSRLRVSEAEVRQMYEDQDMGWQIWPAHIRSKTEEEARETLALLQDGADFAKLARERSIAPDAARGGDLRQFFGPSDMVPALAEGLFHLEPGEYSEPIQTIEGWEVLMVLDKRRLPLGEVHHRARTRILHDAYQAKYDSLVASLEEHYEVDWSDDGLAAALRTMEKGAVEHDPGDMDVVSFRGGSIDLNDVVRAHRKHRVKTRLDDRGGMVTLIRRFILADSLICQVALDRGWDQEPEFRAWKEERRRELMATELHRQEVGNRVSVSQEEARRYYDQNPGSFDLPDHLYLTEVLLDSREEAEQVLAEIRSGAALEDLSNERSLRRMTAQGFRDREDDAADDFVSTSAGWFYRFDEDGTLFVPGQQNTEYHNILGDDPERHIGELQGPVQLADGWAVFRLERHEPRLITFDRVARFSALQVRRRRERERFSVFMDSLRTALSDQIEWLDQQAAQHWRDAGSAGS